MLDGKPRYKEIFRESRMSNVSDVANVSEAVVFKSGFAMKNRFMLAPLTNSQSHEDGRLYLYKMLSISSYKYLFYFLFFI